MRKQAELYLMDLYKHGKSSYYDQGNRIRNYQRRILPRLRKEGLVGHAGWRITGRSRIRLRELTTAGHSLVKSFSKNKPGRNGLWNVLNRLQKYCKR